MYVTGFPADSDCWICGKKIEGSFWWDDRGKSHWPCDVKRRTAEQTAEAEANTYKSDDPPTLMLLKEAISLCRKEGLAGQHLDAMCSARDDLTAFLHLWNEIKEQPEMTVAEIEKRMRAIIECELP